jgi:ferredoxin
MSLQFIDEKNKITVVPCYRDLNILAHAQLEEISVGSQCGGHGICGKDKIKIVAPNVTLSPLTGAELKHLSKTELDEGWRLACQCWPESDHETAKIYIRK